MSVLHAPAHRGGRLGDVVLVSPSEARELWRLLAARGELLALCARAEADRVVDPLGSFAPAVVRVDEVVSLFGEGL